MNKEIETRLKELRLAGPSPELRSKILLNANSAWREEGAKTALQIEFRYIMAVAASFMLFAGTITSLNRMEAKDTRLAFEPYWTESRTSPENIVFLEEIGLAH